MGVGENRSNQLNGSEARSAPNGELRMTIDLPWPPSTLRPNASSPGNWRRKSDAAKRYKADCLILSLALPKLEPKQMTVSLEFCPPDKRRRDIDNMLSSFKQGLDAVSQAIGVDDYLFDLNLKRGEPVKNGLVRVSL